VNAIEEKIREEAKRLLDEKKADVVIGYEMGTLPLQTTSCFITSSDEVDRLIWNPCCKLNLANYVHSVLSQHRESQKRVKPEDKKSKVVAVVARGCTSRSLVIHLQEKQYNREDIVIIGVPCQGYIDKNKLLASVDAHEIIAGSIEGDTVRVETAKGETRVTKTELLADNCLECRFNNPVIYDFMAGNMAPAPGSNNEFAVVDAFAALPEADRWAYFSTEMNKCNRCYACRNVCPSCYCKVCFVEQSQPEWVGAEVSPSDSQVFQIMRMFHMAGRCVDCGSCVEVCAEGVDLRKFLKKLDKDDLDLYGHRAGAELDKGAPLSTFREDDKEAFIFEPE